MTLDKQMRDEVDGKFSVKDFYNGSEYVDEDGCIISREEAQAEVDYMNGRD